MTKYLQNKIQIMAIKALQNKVSASLFSFICYTFDPYHSI